MEQLNTALLRTCAGWLAVIAVVLTLGLAYIGMVLTIAHQDVVLPAMHSAGLGVLFVVGIGLAIGFIFGTAYLIHWLFPKLVKAICLAPFWLWYRVLGMGKNKK